MKIYLNKLLKRIKALGRFQKCVLAALCIMIAVFTALYIIANRREVVRYGDSFLTKKQSEASTIYSGRNLGRRVEFIVGEGRVSYRIADKKYGPYTVLIDDSAIPEFYENTADFGVELRLGERIVFRGAAVKREYASEYWFFSESIFDETLESDTLELSEYGPDADEPLADDLLKFAFGPATERRGNWFIWFIGVFFCALIAIDVMFPDELFRYRMSFRIREPEKAEPSDWELEQRHIGWLLAPFMTAIVFIWGLVV